MTYTEKGLGGFFTQRKSGHGAPGRELTKLHGLRRRARTPGGLGKAGNGSRVAGSGGSRPDRGSDVTSDEHQAPWVSGSHGRAPAGESTGEVRGEGDMPGKEEKGARGLACGRRQLAGAARMARVGAEDEDG